MTIKPPAIRRGRGILGYSKAIDLTRVMVGRFIAWRRLCYMTRNRQGRLYRYNGFSVVGLHASSHHLYESMISVRCSDFARPHVSIPKTPRKIPRSAPQCARALKPNISRTTRKLAPEVGIHLETTCPTCPCLCALKLHRILQHEEL